MSDAPTGETLGPPPRAPRRSRAARGLLVATAGLVILVVAALVVIVAFRVFGPSQTVSVTGRLDVETCALVTDLGGGLIAVDETSCAGDAAIFYVAGFEPGVGRCVGAGVARIAIDGRTLCLTPNLRVGRCYLLPRVDPTPQGYERKGCTTIAGAADQPIVEVTRRVDGTTEAWCGPGESTAGFTRPRPLAYCLRPTRPAQP